MPDEEYPDSEPDGLGDLKRIERLPAMKANPPKIKWGSEYRGWPIKRRLFYAEKLACAMNHAADVLQTERNSALEHAADLEKQLEQAKLIYLEQGNRMHEEIQRSNAEKQELYTEIVSAKKEVRKLRGELKVIKKGSPTDGGVDKL